MAQTQFIYGLHSVMAALDSQPENILVLYCEDKMAPSRVKQLLEKAQENDIVPQYLSRSKLEKLVSSTHHQGVAAKIKPSLPKDPQMVLDWLETSPKKPLLLILDGIQDPHNLGACLRSAQALGVDFVIVPKMHSAPLNATVSKVACGADQTIPVIQVSNLARFLGEIRERGVWVVGTKAGADKMLFQVDLVRSTAIVMGSEGKGVKRLVLDSCDEVVGIPLLGTVASLNVSVATGICLYECLRQRTTF